LSKEETSEYLAKAVNFQMFTYHNDVLLPCFLLFSHPAWK